MINRLQDQCNVGLCNSLGFASFLRKTMLPLDDDFKTAFIGPAERFEAEYDFKRPKNNEEQLIIIAASGRGDDARAEEAAQFLSSLNYPSVRVFAGGLENWRHRGGRVR